MRVLFVGRHYYHCPRCKAKMLLRGGIRACGPRPALAAPVEHALVDRELQAASARTGYAQPGSDRGIPVFVVPAADPSWQGSIMEASDCELASDHAYTR